MFRPRRQPAGFSLIEVLLVISLMAILAGLVLPSANPSIHDELEAAGRIVAGDLAYGRSLAVSYASRYRLDFDLAANRYVLRHSGTDPALDTLPDSPFRNPDDPPNRYVVDLDELPRLGVGVRIAALGEAGDPAAVVSGVEFGPLGETTRSGDTLIWLSAGSGSAQRYLVLEVNAVTGLVTTGPFSAQAPPGSRTQTLAP